MYLDEAGAAGDSMGGQASAHQEKKLFKKIMTIKTIKFQQMGVSLVWFFFFFMDKTISRNPIG